MSEETTTKKARKMNEQEVDGNSTSLADLQPHLIESILSYCFRDRFVLKFVCKAFHDAIWKVFGGNFLLMIDMDKDEDVRKISAILNDSIAGCHPIRLSNIRIKSRWNNATALEQILPFFEARGEFVKNLEILFFNVNQAQRILAHTKNLRKLLIPSMKLDLTELVGLSEIRVAIMSDGSQLRDVKLRKNSIKWIKLTTTNFNEADLSEFVANQNSIKSMELEVDHFEGSTMNYGRLKLESLVIRRLLMSHSGLPKELISTQSSLKVLKITKMIYNEDLDLITRNLQQLEELEGNFNEVSAEYFDKLARLQKLKRLSIFCPNFENFLLSDLKLQVSSLSISSDGLTAENLRQVTRKFPKLTKVHFNKFLDHFEHILEIFSHFQHLEEAKFILTRCATPLSQSTSVLNENLKALDIRDLMKLELKYLKYFPNLTKLVLSVFNERDDSVSFKEEIEEIFHNLPKLRVLCLKYREMSKVDFDIITLINDNPNLEIIYFDNISFNPDTIQMNELERRFEITQIRTNVHAIARLSLLFVTDSDVLVKNQPLCRTEDYRRALKYNRV